MAKKRFQYPSASLSETWPQREVMAAERVQPPPTSPEYMRAKRSGEASMSEYILSGKWKGYTPPPLPER